MVLEDVLAEDWLNASIVPSDIPTERISAPLSGHRGSGRTPRGSRGRSRVRGLAVTLIFHRRIDALFEGEALLPVDITT
jgi:hypothetical protein